MNFDLINYLECLTSSILETLVLLIVIFSLAQYSCKIDFTTIFKFSFFAFTLATITYIDNNSLFFRILPIILNFILIWAVVEKKLVHCIYLTIIMYICIIIIQSAIVLIFPFTATMQDNFIVQVFANILTLIIAMLIARFIPIHYIYDFIIRKDTAFRFLLCDTFVITITVCYLLNAHLTHFMANIIIIAIVLALMLFVNVELLRSRFIVDKQQNIIDSYNKYLPIVDELIAQVRSRQHGYDNNIQSLYALSQTCRDYESLKAELSKNLNYMSDSDLPAFLLKFNQKLLSGLLFQKYSVAQKKHINMEFTINNYNIETNAPEYIIVEAVGILIDNAVEASNENDTIYVVIDCIENKFYFNIMNVGPVYTSELHKKMFKRGYSTKAKTERERGLGLPQLLDIIKYYKGDLEVGNRTCDDKQYIFFSVTI